MPAFKDGTHVNADYARGNYQRLRISAGPCRGMYVDELVLTAKLGRPLLPGMTVEHSNGDSLDPRPDNLIEVTQSQNTKLMHIRRNKAKAKGKVLPPVCSECMMLGIRCVGRENGCGCSCHVTTIEGKK
jgi:hypothetical protein